jgi:UDP-N-acetylmuramate: L-alanyl-gamma-D-glutamyl-meso-diaminopimelate ligase
VKKAFGILIRVLPENGALIFNADDPNAREVAGPSRATTKIAAGLGAAADEKFRATDLVHEPEASHFTLLGERFSVPMVGEINVRNATMAILAAHHCGVPLDAARRALAGFRGVKRRQVMRGETNGVKIVEDFGKHPTNIRETIKALRHRFPGARVWAVVDPRSNTMCRAAIQRDLTDALAHSDGAIIGPVDRPERFGPGEALEPAAVARELTANGKPSFAEADVDAIVARIREVARPGDAAVLFSSGGFGGIFEKLLGKA